MRGPAGAPPVGGIAVVFNAEREFRAMLDDVLDGRPGGAAFVDASGRVVACSDPAMAQVQAAGYQEFKRQDGYDNGIRAVVALRLGALERRKRALYDTELRQPAARSGTAPVGLGTQAHTQRPQRELALFQVGAERYAFPVDAVMEALPDTGLVRLVQSTGPVVGLLDVGPANGGRVLRVPCARRLFGVPCVERETDGVMRVLSDPYQPRRTVCGFRVDDLNSALDMDLVHIQPAPAGLRARCDWLDLVVRLQPVGARAEDVLIQLSSPAALPARAPLLPLPAAEAASV